MRRKVTLLACVVALAPDMASADVRHDSIPKSYWGTWAADAEACTDEKSRLMLAAKSYISPEVTCTVDYVSEIAGSSGATYSARLQCSSRAEPSGKPTVANLIIRPDGTDRMSAGPSFTSLKVYQRCPE
jgi:hypothetical protein